MASVRLVLQRLRWCTSPWNSQLGKGQHHSIVILSDNRAYLSPIFKEEEIRLSRPGRVDQMDSQCSNQKHFQTGCGLRILFSLDFLGRFHRWVPTSEYCSSDCVQNQVLLYDNIGHRSSQWACVPWDTLGSHSSLQDSCGDANIPSLCPWKPHATLNRDGKTRPTTKKSCHYIVIEKTSNP